jgi:predicted phage terminase large subunit-like protein
MPTVQVLRLPFSKIDLERELATRSFRQFVELAWKYVEPARKFIPGWHIDAICEHLEAVTRGEIRNLLINMPPRHMKSTLVSVLWPAWVWTHSPHVQWIFSSYAHALSTRDSVKCRRLIESPWYQALFSDRYKISPDQNQKIRFSNTKNGERIATSVGGSGTGEGGDIIVVDDPHNVKDKESETVREATTTWWDEVMGSRGNNQKTVARVIVMQRVHDKDLSGHVLKKGGYDHLCLPAEFESSRKKNATTIGWTDPRTKDGELLWAENFGRTEVDQLKVNLGTYGAASQLQQNPVPVGGGLFKRIWWKRYRELPMDMQQIVQFWDCAQKPGLTNDYSVCATWGKTTTGLYLIDIWRNKVEAPQLEMALLSQASRFTPSAILIEDKSAGSSLIQYAKQKTILPIIAYDPKQRDKEVRATAATPTIEAGNCFLPESAPWVEDFILEHERFNNADHDDQVDTTSMMVEYFSKPSLKPRARSL